MHKHELFIRTTKPTGEITLARLGSKDHASKETLDELINIADESVVAAGQQDTDAVIYKIDGVCEYMISVAFFKYPNTPEWWNDRKNTGKGQQRRDRFQRQGARSPRKTQPRSA